MATTATGRVTWKKSSRSTTNGGSCVEVATLPDQVWLRDSKLGDDSPVFRMTRDEFRVFLSGVKQY